MYRRKLTVRSRSRTTTGHSGGAPYETRHCGTRYPKLGSRTASLTSPLDLALGYRSWLRRRHRYLAPTVNDSFTVQRPPHLHTPLSMVCSTAVKHTTSHNKRHTATLHSNLPHFLERKTPNFNLKTRKTTTLPQAVHPVDNRNTNPIELANSISEKRRDHSTPY